MTLLERDLENQALGEKRMRRVMTKKLNAEKKKNEAEKRTLIERMLRCGKMTLEETAEDMGVSLFEIQKVAKHM